MDSSRHLTGILYLADEQTGRDVSLPLTIEIEDGLAMVDLGVADGVIHRFVGVDVTSPILSVVLAALPVLALT